VFLSLTFSVYSFNSAFAGASPTLDQTSGNTWTLGTGTAIFAAAQFLGQSFTPGFSVLDRVTVAVFDGDSGAPQPITYTMNIRLGTLTGSILGTDTAESIFGVC